MGKEIEDVNKKNMTVILLVNLLINPIFIIIKNSIYNIKL